ncbi:hypothetical protein [Streptacidiphilus sp. P02-A3a]|nr:hypothetical protein [Streptacidiphilus sp. P02-A3a]
MTRHFAHPVDQPAWISAVLAITSWLSIAGIAGIALLLGAG